MKIGTRAHGTTKFLTPAHLNFNVYSENGIGGEYTFVGSNYGNDPEKQWWTTEFEGQTAYVNDEDLQIWTVEGACNIWPTHSKLRETVDLLKDFAALQHGLMAAMRAEAAGALLETYSVVGASDNMSTCMDFIADQLHQMHPDFHQVLTATDKYDGTQWILEDLREDEHGSLSLEKRKRH